MQDRARGLLLKLLAFNLKIELAKQSVMPVTGRHGDIFRLDNNLQLLFEHKDKFSIFYQISDGFQFRNLYQNCTLFVEVENSCLWL